MQLFDDQIRVICSFLSFSISPLLLLSVFSSSHASRFVSPFVRVLTNSWLLHVISTVQAYIYVIICTNEPRWPRRERSRFSYTKREWNDYCGMSCKIACSLLKEMFSSRNERTFIVSSFSSSPVFVKWITLLPLQISIFFLLTIFLRNKFLTQTNFR